MVFISREKLHVSAHSGHLQFLTILLYKTLLAKNCQNLKIATMGRNM